MDKILPFRFILISSQSPRPFQDGYIISTIDLCGVFLCKQGEVEVAFGTQTYRICAGDMYVYTPSTLVRLLHVSDDTEGIMVEVEVSYILPIIYKVVNVETLLHLRQHPCVSLPADMFQRIECSLRALYNRSNQEELSMVSYQRRSITIELLKSMGQVAAYELLNVYLANQPLKPLPQGRRDAVFSNFMLNLFRHYRSERDVAFYADLQHMSPRYFSTIIKAQSKKTPLQWIVEMVITEAKLLLGDSELSIKEVASRLNFPTQSFFGKYFKQYVGVSPKEYRETL